MARSRAVLIYESNESHYDSDLFSDAMLPLLRGARQEMSWEKLGGMSDMEERKLGRQRLPIS